MYHFFETLHKYPEGTNNQAGLKALSTSVGAKRKFGWITMASLYNVPTGSCICLIVDTM